jgi:intracellular sulfur oxidation DsrE/DsrF family protein
MRRSFLAFTAAGLAAALVGTACLPALAQDAVKPMRVVVQVSEADPARWNLVLNNVKNLQDEVGAANVSIEIVAYGPGIGMLKFDAPTNSRVSEAVKAGVAVQACENTMRNQKLVKADMHPNVTYVPAGVVQIVKRQQEGWAYLRP